MLIVVKVLLNADGSSNYTLHPCVEPARDTTVFWLCDMHH